eukprot:7875569-Alexandrium_andersonii.AAC.1
MEDTYEISEDNLPHEGGERAARRGRGRCTAVQRPWAVHCGQGDWALQRTGGLTSGTHCCGCALSQLPAFAADVSCFRDGLVALQAAHVAPQRDGG